MINIRLYNGTGWISTSPVTGQKYQVSFNVKAPVLKVEPGRLELSADGKPKPLQVTYCTQEGERMSIANAYASSSTVLNSELYNTYLSPLFTFSSGLGRFLDPGTSQGITEVGVRCLYKDGGTLAGYTGTWDETAIRVQPRNASQISRADIAVKVIAPFTYSGTTRLLGYIANHALDSDRFRSRPAASAMLVGEYLQNAPGIGASPERVSVECPASDIGLSLGSNGLLLVSRKDTPLVSSGKYTVSATLTNLVSGQTMTESIGYVEIYAIASIGAMANAPVEPSSLQNAGIMERYMVNSECIGIVADIPCSKPYGNVLSGVRSIRDALQGCNFLRYTGLPPRYANYERLLMAYVIPSDLWAVNVPIYVNMDYARDSAGKKISTEDVEKLLRYAESIGDFSMIRGCYWYEYSFSNYDAPKPPGMAVWTYRPGLNMKKEWNAMIAAEGGPESPIECFLEMNEPSIGVVTDAMDQVLTRYNSGTYWFYYTDSAEKGGLGLPYELLCVTPRGQTNCYWSSTTVSPDWP